jgi:ABC-type sugar transport system ATPase subunit/ribose/xylose/arabinose/galactoside ABC-type transport system permease subunit
MSRANKIFSGYSWEIMLGVLIVITVALASNLSPYYLTFDQISYSLANTIVIPGILGIAFMLIIVLGEIDLSLPAILAIGTVTLAKLSEMNVPVYLALPMIMIIGAILGAFNGWLIGRFSLPSMAVTIGMMGAYRALALFIGGEQGFAAGSFKPSYLWLGSAYLFNKIPVSLCFLVLLFIVFIYIMNRTVFGRLSYAIGNNEPATKYSGHNTLWLKIKIFGIAGAISAFAAYQYIGQYQSAKADNASTILLLVVACVVLGGFDINGGKGKVIGLGLSLLLLGTVSNIMGLLNIEGPVQTLTIGLIMVFAISIPVVIDRIKTLFKKTDEPEAAPAVPACETVDKTSSGLDESGSQTGVGHTKCLLSLEGITKSYGGIHALKNVSFKVMAGEIHGICGENGAGKSTLIKVISGLIQADCGKIVLNNQEVSFRTPMEARENGVVAMYQDPQLFPNLSIAENVFMGVQPVTRLRTINRMKMNKRTKEIFDSLDVNTDANSLVAGLTIAEMQFVQFARSYVGEEKLLYILDEPTASLTPSETQRLFAFLKELRAKGKSVIIITHRLEELEGLADTITVLRDGEHIITKPKKDMSRDEIIKYMVGRSLDHLYTSGQMNPKKAPAGKAGQDVLQVNNLRQLGIFEDISFAVKSGEIVGMTGLVGAGRTEIAETIFGIIPETSGKVIVNGEEVRKRTPEKMVKRGVAYLPEDRDNKGCVTQLSVSKNIGLSIVKRLSKFGILNKDKELNLSQNFKNRLQIKVNDLENSVKSLSGGNRQKVVLSKWLAVEPKVLILDEPTHGIDVAVKDQVHQIIRELAEEGIGILVISSDLPEVLSISDRILVISEGELVADFNSGEATQEKIMEAAILKKGKK